MNQGAIARKASGKYDIDYAKAESTIASMSELVLYMQATGDAKGASDLVGKFASVPATLKADIVNLELEKIPVDIRLTYER